MGSDSTNEHGWSCVTDTINDDSSGVKGGHLFLELVVMYIANIKYRLHATYN